MYAVTYLKEYISSQGESQRGWRLRVPIECPVGGYIIFMVI